MLLILNHKMNLNIEDITEYEKVLRDYDVVVMPQTPYMGLFTRGRYILGSQCISEYTATGGVSAESLKHLNVKYVLVGHYERRNIKRDTDEVINKKIIEAINHNICPILCIGDESEDDLNKVKEQIKNVFNDPKIDIDKVLIAYEPIHSIGTGIILPKNIIEEKINDIKEFIKIEYNTNNKILYGGSVNQSNILELKEIKNIDGVIVGSASLNIEEVINIYNKINNSN